jgi:hypothetical protein
MTAPRAFDRVARVSMVAAYLTASGLLVPSRAAAQDARTPSCDVRVVGFSGGHILPEWLVLSEFGRIARSVRALGLPAVCVRTFPGILEPVAFQWVRQSFQPWSARRITPDDVAKGPAIVMYGYSSGGWSALALARRLGKAGIPVQLLVLIDTPWFGKTTVASNVKTVANFYEHRTILPVFWGTSRIRLDDPAQTDLLANVRVPKVGHFEIPKLSEILDLITATVTADAGPATRRTGAETRAARSTDGEPAGFPVALWPVPFIGLTPW